VRYSSNMLDTIKMARRVVSRWLSAGDFDNMSWVEYVGGPSKGLKTQICESCRSGKHLSYGMSHLPPNFKNELKKIEQEHPGDVENSIDEIDDIYRYTCKNVGILDGKRVQCMCSAPTLAKGWIDLPF